MNINIKSHYGHDECYVDESSAAALESLPETAWPALVEAASHLGGDDPGIDTEVVVSHNALADFGGHWHKCATREAITVDGYPALYCSGVKVRKCDRRVDLVVLDLGDVRVCQIG